MFPKKNCACCLRAYFFLRLPSWLARCDEDEFANSLSPLRPPSGTTDGLNSPPPQPPQPLPVWMDAWMDEQNGFKDKRFYKAAHSKAARLYIDRKYFKPTTMSVKIQLELDSLCGGMCAFIDTHVAMYPKVCPTTNLKMEPRSATPHTMVCGVWCADLFLESAERSGRKDSINILLSQMHS